MGAGAGKHGKRHHPADEHVSGASDTSEPPDEELPAPTNEVLPAKEFQQLSTALTTNNKEKMLEILSSGKLSFDTPSAQGVYVLGMPCSDAMYAVMLESKTVAELPPMVFTLVMEDNLQSIARVRMLLARGASPNAKLRNSRKPPLSMAVRLQNLPLIHTLLRYGVDVNRADSQGLTALHEAVLQAHFRPIVPEIFELLMANGADLSAKDCNNESPLDAMLRLNVWACKRYMLKQKIP